MPQTTPSAPPAQIDSPDIRQAGHELLSLALMDARNQTLHLLTQFEQALGETNFAVPQLPETEPPLWLAGHVGWFAEWWIGRNTQRALGAHAPAEPVRLASVEPSADRWWNPALAAHSDRWKLDLPDAAGVRAWLLDTLESTLELLEKTPDQDDALYFYRLALFHEDLRGEQLLAMAQTLGLPMQLQAPGAVTLREPMLVPATRWMLGSSGPGFHPDNECPAHEVSVPEFEIDAQAVTWSQFVEFVDDGGYDRQELWHPDGWTWLQGKADAEGRRGPRYVEQIGVASGAVMQTRFGKTRRMLGNQTAMHMSWWEADAWCRWAGRRLPSEVEWEVAVHTAARRGLRWGDVHEWTGTTFRGYPGFVAGPWRDYSEPWFSQARVLRGASFATRARMRHPKLRSFALPQRDDGFVGFRSCAF